MAAPVTLSEVGNELVELKRRYRGVTYVLRELPMDKYDATVRQATTEIDDNGVKVEKFDGVAHTKLLLAKCLVEPKLSPEELYGRGTRLVRQLQRDLQTIHFDDEPEEEIEDDAGEAKAGS